MLPRWLRFHVLLEGSDGPRQNLESLGMVEGNFYCSFEGIRTGCEAICLHYVGPLDEKVWRYNRQHDINKTNRCGDVCVV